MEKNKYSLTSFRNNETIYPEYLPLKNEIEVIDLVTFYYYLLYPSQDYEGEYHNYYELFVCLNGKARVTINGKTFILNEKEFLITSPGETHSHNPDHSYLSSVSISFSAEGVNENLICNKIGKINEEEQSLLSILINEYINNYEHQDKYTHPYVKNVVIKHEFGYKQVFKGILETLLILITRNFQNDDTKQIVDLKKEEKERENPIVQYIKQNYKERVSLEDISKKFNYSVGHLCRKFKEETGDTIIEYTTKYRISIAMRLLYERSELNIEEVALEVGFSDLQYFTKSFKRCVGVTPGKYRQEVTSTNAIHAQDVIHDVVKNI